MVLAVAPQLRGGGFLSLQGGGGHLSARHAIDGVVDKDGGELLAAHGRVHDFGGADGSQVAIPLIGEYGQVGVCALNAGGDSGCAAMGGLNKVAVEVVAGIHGAAHRADAYGACAQVQLDQSFGD